MVVRRLVLLFAFASLSCGAQSSKCINHFSVVRFDPAGHPTFGLTPDELKWYQDKLQKKYPSICYDAEGHGNVRVILGVSVSERSGTQRVDSTQNVPVNTDVTIVNPSTGATSPGTLSGTMAVTTASDVPYETTDSFYMLRLETWGPDGKWTPVLYRSRNQARQHGGNGYAALGTNLRERHPYHGLIEDALKFMDSQR